MGKTVKQTRLDQLEIEHRFGILPDETLIRRARRASEALFRYDTLRCGTLEHRGGRDYDVRIEMVDERKGRRCGSETGEGIRPHFFRAGYDRDGQYFLKDCGAVRDAEKVARGICEELTRWFADNKRPDLSARLGGDLRYIVVGKTGEKRFETYALID